MDKKTLLAQVKSKVQELEPEAEILLYGSRARGDALPDSDWDFLILIDKSIDDDYKMKIRHKLYEVEWEANEVISSIIFSRGEWCSPRFQVTPLYQNIHREGILI